MSASNKSLLSVHIIYNIVPPNMSACVQKFMDFYIIYEIIKQ